MTGTEFLRLIGPLTGSAREGAILAAFAAEMCPSFLFNFLPVRVQRNGHDFTFYVTRDYLAIGTDADWVRVPMTAAVAQAVADARMSVLPTPKMVDDIYAAAPIKLPAISFDALYPRTPKPASRELSVVYGASHAAIELARGTRAAPATLLAGHKKDLVLTNGVATHPGKIVIYGWHGRDGHPIQPVFPTESSAATSGHGSFYADYSHGARLVSQTATLDGQQIDIRTIMQDPELSRMVNGAPLRTTRYNHALPALRDLPTMSNGAGSGLVASGPPVVPVDVVGEGAPLVGSVGGRWVLPPDVKAIGEGQMVRYDNAPPWNGPSGCSGSLTAGARELGDYIKRYFPASVATYGGYACRANTGSDAQTSVHGTGRAVDLMVAKVGGRADNGKGDVIANWLVRNAKEIGVQLVIWDRTIWNASRATLKDRAYTGPHPHDDHLHVELNLDGAARLTRWFAGANGQPPYFDPGGGVVNGGASGTGGGGVSGSGIGIIVALAAIGGVMLYLGTRPLGA